MISYPGGECSMISPLLFLIDRSILEKSPSASVKILLGAAKIANELNLATKYLYFAKNGLNNIKEQETAQNAAKFTTFQYFLRNLAGHTYEGNLFINKSNIKRIVQSDELANNTAFQDARSCIHKYFCSANNLIKIIRNKISFHTDADFIYSAMLQDTGQSFQFATIIGDYLGHTIFYGIEKILDGNLSKVPASKALPDDDPMFQTALDQIPQIADFMGVVLHELIKFVCIRDLRVDPVGSSHKLIPFEAVPIDTVELPFFCMPPVRA